MNSSNPTLAFTPDALEVVGVARVAYLRKVYSYFGLGMLGGVIGSLIAMNTGLALFMAHNFFIGIIALFGMLFLANKNAANPATALPTLFAFTFVSGVILSPTLFFIARRYIPGIGVEVIYEALFLTSLIFAGLTAYVFVTKKDFTYMGATLMIGLFLVIGVSLVNLFFASANVSLAVAVVTSILFSGFILYDTSRIIRNAHAVPPTMAALSLYLDFLNLFMALLQILTGGRRRN